MKTKKTDPGPASPLSASGARCLLFDLASSETYFDLCSCARQGKRRRVLQSKTISFGKRHVCIVHTVIPIHSGKQEQNTSCLGCMRLFVCLVSKASLIITHQEKPRQRKKNTQGDAPSVPQKSVGNVPLCDAPFFFLFQPF